MVKVYLFIELVGSAEADDVVAKLKSLQLDGCQFANVVVLADDKIVAQLDCETGESATAAILERISAVDGVVQTNVIAAVRPVRK